MKWDKFRRQRKVDKIDSRTRFTQPHSDGAAKAEATQVETNKIDKRTIREKLRDGDLK